MNLTPDTSPQGKTASTTVPVHPLLAERWSPRGFDRAHEIGDEALAALLEAARWAPSAQNSQPWRFLVTRRGEPAHDRLFAALAPGNQAWAGRASALVLVVLAIGLPGDTAGLPEPLAAREAAPRTRHPLSDLLLPASPAPQLTAA
jgi:nitroreductase